jgi:hypothetical protein
MSRVIAVLFLFLAFTFEAYSLVLILPSEVPRRDSSKHATAFRFVSAMRNIRV